MPSDSLPVAPSWYRVEAVHDSVTLITEPHVRGLLRANAWLVHGRDRDVLVDCGLGVTPLRPTVIELTGRDPVVVLTHSHLDHMGAAYEFNECWAHPLERAAQPSPGSLLGHELAAQLGLHEVLPDLLIRAVPHAGYDPAGYRVHPAAVSRQLRDGDVVDLGDRTFTVYHLPGHSRGSIALFDQDDRVLLSGDVVYDDVLIDGIVGANVGDYVASLRRLRELPVRIVHPGHGPSFDGGRLRQLINRYLRLRAAES